MVIQVTAEHRAFVRRKAEMSAFMTLGISSLGLRHGRVKAGELASNARAPWPRRRKKTFLYLQVARVLRVLIYVQRHIVE